MLTPRGTLVLVLILLVCFSVTFSRAVFREKGPPAFFLEKHQGITVLLGDGFPSPGVYQFSDGTTPMGVIGLTGLAFKENQVSHPALSSPLQSGEMLTCSLEGLKIGTLQRSWMPAKQRMALSIPLHPECMNYEDWQALPGIGPRLAEKIEKDRQQNGDFGSLEGLKRVRGIGPKRIKVWKIFF